MLKTYPEHLLRLARDGVIGPRAMGAATHGGQIEQAARRRAGQALAEVATQAEQARAAAAAQGRAEGLADAIAQALPPLTALLGDAAALRQAALAELALALRESLAAEGLCAALVIQRCTRLLAGTDAITVYVPQADTALVEALQARLAALPAAQRDAVQIRRAGVPLPLLKAGGIMVELDPQAAVMAAVDHALDSTLVQANALQRRQALRACAFPAAAALAEAPLPLETHDER
ncbi:hypothetical protein [Stenotrophomonas sp.]|uniref:hypothetical protein n=1 Tax=Stenotrophomonas sp. TaxID=69392 RepID=UPI002FCC250D